MWAWTRAGRRRGGGGGGGGVIGGGGGGGSGSGGGGDGDAGDDRDGVFQVRTITAVAAGDEITYRYGTNLSQTKMLLQ